MEVLVVAGLLVAAVVEPIESPTTESPMTEKQVMLALLVTSDGPSVPIAFPMHVCWVHGLLTHRRWV